MYKILISRTFQKQYHSLEKKAQKRIRKALSELEKNPFEARSGADIKMLKDTKPRKHRIRVGDFRIIYLVEKKIVKVIEVFRRGRGY